MLDDLDFAMFDLTDRPGPAKAATAPEQDPTERRLDQEREAAPFIAEATGVEVRWGSGSVKI